MQENISGLHFSKDTFQKLCPMLWFASDITLDAEAITKQDLKIIASHSMMSFTGLMALAETAGYHLMTDDVIAAAVKYNKIFKRSLETDLLCMKGTYYTTMINSQFAQKHQNVQRQRKVTKVADPVFERNQKWLEKRQLKQQQKRSEKLKSSAEKCTVRCQPTLFRINIT